MNGQRRAERERGRDERTRDGDILGAFACRELDVDLAGAPAGVEFHVFDSSTRASVETANSGFNCSFAGGKFELNRHCESAICERQP